MSFDGVATPSLGTAPVGGLIRRCRGAATARPLSVAPSEPLLAPWLLHSFARGREPEGGGTLSPSPQTAGPPHARLVSAFLRLCVRLVPARGRVCPRPLVLARRAGVHA